MERLLFKGGNESRPKRAESPSFENDFFIIEMNIDGTNERRIDF